MAESLLPMPQGSPALTERRVLVTGGAGFMGTHLCERLLERGDEVLCVDNFYTGTRRNVQHLLDDLTLRCSSPPQASYLEYVTYFLV